MQHKISFLSLLIAFSSFLLITFAPKVMPVQAWFGAGNNGWQPTTTGLQGDVIAPFYQFSPNAYQVGDTVSINNRATSINLANTSDITATYYLVIARVIEAPNGTNITDGQPALPGYTEDQLNTFHQNGNDTQQIVHTHTIGSVTVPANSTTTFSTSYLTTMTGYFQFDITDRDPNLPYEDGHILTAGFFRVLAGQGATPTPTPSPSASPTPSPSPSPSPSINPCQQIISRDEVQLDESPCVTPTPSPTPVVTPTPNPTPTSTPNTTPGPSKSSSLGKDGPTCDNGSFKATMDLRDENNNPVKNVKVKFTYRGEVHESTTNDNGRAETNYTFSADDSVYASADGFASQALFVASAKNCAAGSGAVLGASTTDKKKKSGAILGASTLAATGRNYTELFYFGAAGLLMVIGASGYVYSTRRA